MTSQTATPGPSYIDYAWITVALLFPVALLNYLDRQMLAAMKQSMVTDIPSISDKEHWGVVLASFKWVYAILSPLGGYVADRCSRRHVIVVSLFVWSMVTFATGFVQTYDQLVCTRALMGISEAFYIPAALALITDFHVGRMRSTAVSVHQAGIYSGLILGGLTGFVAESPMLGWRSAFYCCGVLGILYAVPLMLFLRNPDRQHERESSAPLAALRELLTNRNFLLLVVYFTLPAIAGWVVKDWMPDILREKFSLKQGKAGMVSMFVHPASIVGAAIGYGIMNLVSISCGGFGDWGFGFLRDRNVPLNVIFGAFAMVAAVSIAVVLLIRPQQNETRE